MSEPETESQSDAPPAGRLVIRVKLIPQESPQPPARRPLSKSALLLIVGVVAALLIWLGISIFQTDPTHPPAATQRASTPDAESSAPSAARIEDPPVVSDEPLPKPAAGGTAAARSTEPEVRHQPDAPPSSVNEVIPDVPQSALDTIRGTIRVSVRVTIDKQGAVVDAAADDRGPSRYFERLALDASRKWTFTPASLEERRTTLVRFYFTRAGVTADASPRQ